jgi:membrane protein implicated in regulation of membrane protease activity
MFWLLLSVALFAWEWFNRSLRMLAVTVAATLAAIVSMMGASFSQTLSFFIFETMLNLFLVEMWTSLAYVGSPQHEDQAPVGQDGASATVKVVRWNPDDTAIVLYNGREISAEKESPFIRESNLVDIVKQDGRWLIVKAR